MTWESWIICAPLWLQSGIALTFILLYHMKDRELEVQKNGLCARCSYPLRQSGSNVCPECGRASTLWNLSSPRSVDCADGARSS